MVESFGHPEKAVFDIVFVVDGIPTVCRDGQVSNAASESVRNPSGKITDSIGQLSKHEVSIISRTDPGSNDIDVIID